jgi:hypothetical protein
LIHVAPMEMTLLLWICSGYDTPLSYTHGYTYSQILVIAIGHSIKCK